MIIRKRKMVSRIYNVDISVCIFIRRNVVFLEFFSIWVIYVVSGLGVFIVGRES